MLEKKIKEQIDEIRLAWGATITRAGAGLFSDPVILSVGKREYDGDFIDHVEFEAVFLPLCLFRDEVYIATAYEFTLSTAPGEDWIERYDLLQDVLKEYNVKGTSGIQKHLLAEEIYMERKPSDDFSDGVTTRVNTGNYQKIKTTPSDD